MFYMDLKEAINFLENNSKFKEWIKFHKDDYLSYAFKTFMDENEKQWQLGYYSKTDDTLTTFTIDGENVFIREGEEVFKKEETAVKSLNLDELNMTIEKTMDIANKHKDEKYSHETVIKIMAIIQNLPDLGQIWNLTFITQSFNVLNIKIDANDGKILQEKLESIISFKQN